MYETIVLGATFAAAGIAIRQKKKCLILEQSLQAGYEFFGALNFGTDYDVLPKTEAGKALHKQFFADGVTPYMRNTYIYPILQESNVLFGTQVVSVEKNADGFVCKTFGINGYASYLAKNIIDTRCREAISCGKTYNLLMESNTQPSFDGICTESTGVHHHYVLRFPVPCSWDYSQARLHAAKTLEQFTEGQKLILQADEFDYQVMENLPDPENGIRILPSKAYKNPICAFEAGLEV